MTTSLLEENYSRRIGEDRIFQLESEAKSLWIEYYNSTEKAIGKNGELFDMSDVAIRFPEFVRKFALLAAIIEGRDTITVEDMSRAITLVNYFRLHGERAFSVMRKISLPEEARRTLRAIKKNNLQEFSSREIHRFTGMGAEDSEAGISILADKGYCRLKADQPQPDGAGRKPSPLYEINPQLFEAKHG